MKRSDAISKLVLLLSLFAVLVAFSACHPEPVAPQDARVLIVDPTAESIQAKDEVTINTYVERFNLVNKIGESSGPGEGHIVYYMDVTPPMEQGKSALTVEGTYALSTDTSHTWSGIQPGRHTFWVQLVNNDNTPLQPQAAVRVYVTVAP